jgi:dCMP deaminase
MFDKKWDKRFLALARYVAQWSKDPSTKVGAVIVRPDRTIASMGYNGFPRGMSDHPTRYLDREHKLAHIVHAEINAIANAHEPVHGYCLVTWPMGVCSVCSLPVIQHGIVRVVAPRTPPQLSERWEENLKEAGANFAQVGVHTIFYPEEMI